MHWKFSLRFLANSDGEADAFIRTVTTRITIASQSKQYDTSILDGGNYSALLYVEDSQVERLLVRLNPEIRNARHLISYKAQLQ